MIMEPLKALRQVKEEPLYESNAFVSFLRLAQGWIHIGQRVLAGKPLPQCVLVLKVSTKFKGMTV